MGDGNVVRMNDKRIPIIGQQPEVDIDEWVVVSSYTKEYLGKPAGGVKHAEALLRQENPVLKLDAALDFLMPLRPVQPEPGRVAYTRDPVITPMGFTLFPVPLYVKVTSIYFCKDMEDTDKNTYKSFVAAALAQAKAYRLAKSPLNPGG